MTYKNYEEYLKDVRIQLIKGLKELSKLMDISEIPLDYDPERPYELLEHLEDLIQALKRDASKK